MKTFLLSVSCLLIASAVSAADKLPKPIVTGLKNPESVAVGPDGKIYVSTIGEFGKDGDGAVMVIENGKPKVFVEGLNDPKGLAIFQEVLYVADKDCVWRIGKDAKPVLFAPPNAFPSNPLFLNDLTVDSESGTLYVSDTGDMQGAGGVVYRISPRGLVDVVLDKQRLPALHSPNGLVLDGASHLLLVDFGTGVLYRIKLATGATEQIAEGFIGADGLTWDRHGRLYVSNWKEGTVHVIPRPGEKPVLHTAGLRSAADLCLDATTKFLLVPDMQAGTLSALPAQVPGAEVDNTLLNVTSAVAFPDLQWSGWQPESASGKVVPLRPIALTHAGDGSNRVFMATQHGVVHVFPNDDKVQKSKTFLDLQEKVKYSDETNEEGFLGLAFHPKYKKNGEFFVFYTPRKGKSYTNYISRFRVSRDNPDVADPASEEVLLKIEHPFWNHDGGTIAFGPDGYLYIAVGDGGAGNDPFGNAQNKTTHLGKILRIDVDHKGEKLPYVIPADNPFVSDAKAKPEIWALGLRNVWRFSFDRQTGTCWAADVGQNLFEEINLIKRGGNYGWNLREGLHPFGARGVGPRPEFIEPIWEYHHDNGRSITGGYVYRGGRVPELEGTYVYADYITGHLYSLRYDEKLQRVTANRPISGPNIPVLSFGEDERGEVYYLIVSASGQGIYRFARK